MTVPRHLAGTRGGRTNLRAAQRPTVAPRAVAARLQDVPPKSTSLVSTVPAVRPGAVW